MNKIDPSTFRNVRNTHKVHRPNSTVVAPPRRWTLVEPTGKNADAVRVCVFDTHEKVCHEYVVIAKAGHLKKVLQSSTWYDQEWDWNDPATEERGWDTPMVIPPGAVKLTAAQAEAKTRKMLAQTVAEQRAERRAARMGIGMSSR